MRSFNGFLPVMIFTQLMAFFSFGRSATIASLILLFATLAAGCGGGSTSVQQETTEQRYKRAMAALEDEDYQKAEQEFNTIILQDPASEYADDAQYYLAESYYRDGDFKLAVFNYNRLRSSFPNSQFYKSALFRSGESYYKSSASYDRDQRETRYAIDVFNGYAQIYSADSLAPVARERVKELRAKLAERDFRTAELYVKMDEYKSAIIYYSRVIEEFPDTEYYQRALSGREAAQRELGNP